ncbi:MAG: hypothetical protein ABIQ60_00970 [Burkholderiaceae bacterium]
MIGFVSAEVDFALVEENVDLLERSAHGLVDGNGLHVRVHVAVPAGSSTFRAGLTRVVLVLRHRDQYRLGDNQNGNEEHDHQRLAGESEGSPHLD